MLLVWHQIVSDGEAPVLEIWEIWVTFHCHYSQIHCAYSCQGLEYSFQIRLDRVQKKKKNS